MPHLCRGQGKTASLSLSMERVFKALPLGNVGGDAASRIGFPGMVAKRKLDRQIGVKAVRVGRKFFIFNHAVPLQNFNIVGAKRVRELLGKISWLV